MSYYTERLKDKGDFSLETLQARKLSGLTSLQYGKGGGELVNLNSILHKNISQKTKAN